MGEAWQVVLLALIQGLCEFFPVSSSGHLVIAQALLHFPLPPLLFDIFLHLGTLLAVIIYFRSELLDLVGHWRKTKNRHLLLLLFIASVPTALIGFCGREFFAGLFQSPRLVGLTLLLTALVLFLSRFWRIGLKNEYLVAFIIGVGQGLAIAPGLSRAGLTIAAALILSRDEEFAFRFSFLLSLPAVLGALLLEARDIPWQGSQLPLLGLGMAVAAGCGLLSLGLLRRIMRLRHLHYFAYYCLLVGIAVFILLR